MHDLDGRGAVGMRVYAAVFSVSVGYVGVCEREEVADGEVKEGEWGGCAGVWRRSGRGFGGQR
jgi:hypothetical protein